MKINIPLDSVKKQIREEFRIAAAGNAGNARSGRPVDADLDGTPPWANDQDRTINFAKAVTGEAARLATMGVSVELSGSARADWLQERLNEELIPFLRDMVDVGCAAGMFLLKPTPDSIGLYTPPEFTITAVDNRKRVIGVVLYDTKATPDYYYVKAEYHRYDGTHYVVSNRAFRLTKGKTAASRANLDEVPDWVGILPDAVLDDTAPLFAVCTMPTPTTSTAALAVCPSMPTPCRSCAGWTSHGRLWWTKFRIPGRSPLWMTGCCASPAGKMFPCGCRAMCKTLPGSAAESFYQEIDRKLKTGERQTGINMLLQSLSTKCGFSEGYFSFNEKQGLATATQVEADDRRTIQRIKDIRDRIQNAVDDLIQALNDYADIYDLAPYGTYTVAYNFGDITYSYEEDRQNTKSLCQLGVLPWWMYLVRFEGFSEDDAKAAYAEANTAKPGLFRYRMITPEQFQEIGETLLPLLDDLTEWIARDMIERFMIRFGRGEEKLLTGTDEWQAWVLKQAGGNLDEIQKALAKSTGKSQQEIAKIFKGSGIQAAKADAEAAAVTFSGLSSGMMAIITDAYERTVGEISNITRTTAGANQSGVYRHL